MQNENTLTNQELNELICSIPFENHLPRPKKWARVDCGEIEVYVGDRLYIVALVEKIPDDIDEVTSNQVNTEETVVKYLRSEGFIDEDYAYIGMQRFKINRDGNEEPS